MYTFFPQQWSLNVWLASLTSLHTHMLVWVSLLLWLYAEIFGDQKYLITCQSDKWGLNSLIHCPDATLIITIGIRIIITTIMLLILLTNQQSLTLYTEILKKGFGPNKLPHSRFVFLTLTFSISFNVLALLLLVMFANIHMYWGFAVLWLPTL